MKRITLAFTFASLAAGCASTPKGQTAEDVATVVLAGVAGDRLSDGNATATVAAAGGALLVKKVVDYNNAKKNDKAVQEAFDLGQLQATKSLAAAIQHTQDTDLANAPAADTTQIPLAIPERSIDGVIINGGTEYVRIQR